MLGAFYNSTTTVVVKGLETIAWEILAVDKCIAIHRCLRELMVNMKKHSKANLVALHFEHSKKTLQINYSDNGIGMDKEKKFGVGLRNTASRIESVNGKIIFDSKQGYGAKITLLIPY